MFFFDKGELIVFITTCTIYTLPVPHQDTSFGGHVVQWAVGVLYSGSVSNTKYCGVL